MPKNKKVETLSELEEILYRAAYDADNDPFPENGLIAGLYDIIGEAGLLEDYKAWAAVELERELS